MRFIPFAGLVALSLIFAGTAVAGPGASGHGHAPEATSFGEPGDPKKPARVINITMTESDGKALFIPSRIEVQKGEQIRFILRNNGDQDHEFVLATLEENLKHGEEMKKNPDMEHDDANAKRLNPKKKGELIWKFTKAGEFDFSCLIPGHREAGMFGKIVVK